MSVRVTGLRIYPVKSMAGNSIESAEVLSWGLAGDRRWALVGLDGANLTALRVNALLGFRAELLADSAIRIIDHVGGSITVDVPHGGATIPVGFSRLDHATTVAPEVDKWLTERVGRDVRLVWQEAPNARSIGAHHGGLPGDPLSLADSAPLLLVTESSMTQLNEWVAQDPEDDGAHELLDIVRFRPNVIVDGAEPFSEDEWSRVHIGDTEFRRTELCDRCSMPTIDPKTLKRGKEPTRTLAKHRMWDHNTWFGIRVAPVNLGASSPNVISVGDAVRIERD